MAFEISISRTISAPKEFVFDWWTDLSPNDSKLVKPLKAREVISRTPETIMLRDEEEMYLKKMIFDVKVSLARPDRWIAEYEGKDARATSEYVLNSSGSNTILTYHTSIEPKGFLTTLFSPVVKPFVKHVFSAEMNVFIRTLEHEYNENKQNTK